MKKRLIESRPSLKILLEDEDPLAGLFTDSAESEDKSTKDNNDKEQKQDDKPTEDTSGEDNSNNVGEEGDKVEQEDAPVEPEESEEDKRKAEEEKEKEIEKAVKNATKTFNNVVSYANLDPNLDSVINRKLYSLGEGKMNKLKKIVNESITKYLFKNVYNKVSILNSFSKNNRIINKISSKLNESTDDIISDKFWNENISVDALVDNAIDLTIHFEDQIDIPEMIMNSVAVKFGKMAAEKINDEPNAESEYKDMLDEFMNKYLKKLTQHVEYENYDTSKIRLGNPIPDTHAIGALNKA